MKQVGSVEIPQEASWPCCKWERKPIEGEFLVNDGDRLFVALLCAGAVCVAIILVDGWFLRPKRDPGAMSADEPWLPKIAGYVLVGLALAMLWRLFRYEAVDFSLMLVVVGAVSGLIWGVDQAFFAKRRKAAAARAGAPPERVREPIAVEYARSFFPSSCWCLSSARSCSNHFAFRPTR